MRLTVKSTARRRFFTDLEGFDAMWIDKHAVESIDIDWSKKLGSDTISTSAFTGDGVTVDSESNTTTIATATISNVQGDDNLLLNRITTAAGLTFDKTIKVNEVET